MEDRQKDIIEAIENMRNRIDNQIFELELLLKEWKEERKELNSILVELKSKTKNDEE